MRLLAAISEMDTSRERLEGGAAEAFARRFDGFPVVRDEIGEGLGMVQPGQNEFPPRLERVVEAVTHAAGRGAKLVGIVIGRKHVIQRVTDPGPGLVHAILRSAHQRPQDFGQAARRAAFGGWRHIDAL